MTVATGHGENFPHTFFKCPNCGKKGVYEMDMTHTGHRLERCKYCGWEHWWEPRKGEEPIARSITPTPAPKPIVIYQKGDVVKKYNGEYGVVLGVEPNGNLVVQVSYGYGMGLYGTRQDALPTHYYTPITHPSRIKSKYVRERTLKMRDMILAGEAIPNPFEVPGAGV
jgi:rubredoxin